MDRFPAIRAVLPFIPVRDNGPYAVTLGVRLDLAQAALPAITTLGPARTLAKLQTAPSNNSFNSRAPTGNLDCRWFPGFRAGDQHRSPKSDDRTSPVNQVRGDQRQQSRQEVHSPCHNDLLSGPRIAEKVQLRAPSPSKVSCRREHNSVTAITYLHVADHTLLRLGAGGLTGCLLRLSRGAPSKNAHRPSWTKQSSSEFRLVTGFRMNISSRWIEPCRARRASGRARTQRTAKE